MIRQAVKVMILGHDLIGGLFVDSHSVVLIVCAFGFDLKVQLCGIREECETSSRIERRKRSGKMGTS
jgi:hypothetical protein